MRNQKSAYKEMFVYGAVGVSTTLVNILIYHAILLANLNYRTANLIALITSKIYGYCANKNLVFHSHCASFGELMKELFRFILARGATGLVDYFGLIILVEIFQADNIISKYVIQVIVIVLNYIFGKFLVFKKKEIESGENKNAES